MSFDLNFGRQDGTVPSVEDLKEYFQRLSSIQVNDTELSGVQFWYQNEVTGVYCFFSFSPDDVDEELDQLDHFSASGLTFNLNYIRPSFFAFETMPLVQRFCENFDLLVEDVQEEKVEEADASRLVESWRRHNERAVRALSQQKEDVEMRYLPEERATEWWQYTRIKQSVEDSLTDDVFVPTVIILESPDKRIFTMIVWTQGISQFFPRCDYVLVQRDKKKLFGSKEEVGLVPFDAVMEKISSYLNEYYQASGSIRYLPSNKMSDVKPAIQSLALTPIDLGQHTRVAADAFHDVNLV